MCRASIAAGPMAVAIAGSKPEGSNQAVWSPPSTPTALSSMSSGTLSVSDLGDLAGDLLVQHSYLSCSISLPASKLQQLQMVGQVTPEAFTDVELGPVVGTGSYGKVHTARWHGQRVAVKIVNTTDTVVGSSGEASGALLEAVLAHDLEHPQVVKTLDYALRTKEVECEGGERQLVNSVWILQQFCNRDTLSTCVQRGWLRQDRQPGGAPNLLAILQTAQEVASAMTYLHAKGIIHGDLSSGNVLLHTSDRDYRGFTALVADFGLACLEEHTWESRTASHGTAAYMPPELLKTGLMSPAVDVFSFGVLLWEMWVGSRAWAGLSPTQVMLGVANGRLHLELPPTAPAAFRDLCMRCLSHERSERPTSDQVLQELSLLLEAELLASGGSESARQGGYTLAAEPLVAPPSRKPLPRRVSSKTLSSVSFEEATLRAAASHLQSPFLQAATAFVGARDTHHLQSLC